MKRTLSHCAAWPTQTIHSLVLFHGHWFLWQQKGGRRGLGLTEYCQADSTGAAGILLSCLYPSIPTRRFVMTGSTQACRVKQVERGRREENGRSEEPVCSLNTHGQLRPHSDRYVTVVHNEAEGGSVELSWRTAICLAISLLSVESGGLEEPDFLLWVKGQFEGKRR
ncbi:hypothetical protein PAMP_014806 [Pampus punctatissimus]